MEQPFRDRRDAFLRKVRHSAVMGILNVTPDSFFDGGKFHTIEAATSHAQKLVADGCDIVDIGGESVRPGAIPVSAADELVRIEAIVGQLAPTLDVALSVDTSKARVAARALALGAVAINDVWGLQQDAAMADVVAAADALVVIMHNRRGKDEALDVMVDIRAFFDRSLALAAKAGIARQHIILDPGIGFAKTSRQNRDVLARLDELKDYGLPIMVGVSRKSFLGSLVPGNPEASLIGTVAANLAAAARGATVFRVHDVAEHVAAMKVFRAIKTP